MDEYQDTNLLQSRILRNLKPDGWGVTVVGDDAQAIYGFRAATVRNILDFPSQYDPPARVVTLEHNYRSTQPILDASNAVIGLAAERFTKNLRTDRAGGSRPTLVCVADEVEQARYVAERVLEHRENGIALIRQAVLFRASSHSAAVELELARRNIPYVKFGGLKFLEAAHVKDVLALLRWISNPRGRVAGYRAMRLLPGVGPAIATRAPRRDRRGRRSLDGDARAAHARGGASADWTSLLEVCVASKEASPWPAELDAPAALVRAAPGPPVRGRDASRGGPGAARANRLNAIPAGSASSPT